MITPTRQLGAIYGDPSSPSYITTDGTPVWMWRKGQRVRFLTSDGVQIGPEHSNVGPAICSAAAAGWVDPSNPWLSMMTTIEVRAGSRKVGIADQRAHDLIVKHRANHQPLGGRRA